MKQIHASAGQRVTVIRRAFSSMPIDYRFTARAAVPGEALNGIVEVRKSRWILRGSPLAQPLRPSNHVSAGFWNTFVAVDVIPEIDTLITVEARSVRHIAPLLLIALLVLLAAAVVIVAMR